MMKLLRALRDAYSAKYPGSSFHVESAADGVAHFAIHHGRSVRLRYMIANNGGVSLFDDEDTRMNHKTNAFVRTPTRTSFAVAAGDVHTTPPELRALSYIQRLNATDPGAAGVLLAAMLRRHLPDPSPAVACGPAPSASARVAAELAQAGYMPQPRDRWSEPGALYDDPLPRVDGSPRQVVAPRVARAGVDYAPMHFDGKLDMPHREACP